MFDRFLSMYTVTSAAAPSAEAGRSSAGSPDVGSLLSEFGGATFNHGLYRLHSADAIAAWTVTVGDAFPEFRQRIWCFGYDWLGRHFALDTARVVSGERQVLMFEPGSGEALEIPTTITEFHNGELVDDPEAVLASGLFEEWRRASGIHDLAPDVCVGYRVPLFLGGSDALDNLEVSDLDVYWTICGQLITGVRTLPEGTPIKSVIIS